MSLGAHLKVPVGGETQAVAGGAEVLRHGRDEAHGAARARRPPQRGRVVRPRGARLQLVPRPRRRQRRAVRHQLGVVPAVAGERHELDEPATRSPLSARPAPAALGAPPSLLTSLLRRGLSCTPRSHLSRRR